MTSLERGDVVLVWFPNSDLIIFNPARRGHPSRVFIPLDSPEAKSAGLRTDSIVMTDNLATILDRAIAGKLGRIKDMSCVDAALRTTLGL